MKLLEFIQRIETESAPLETGKQWQSITWPSIAADQQFALIWVCSALKSSYSLCSSSVLVGVVRHIQYKWVWGLERTGWYGVRLSNEDHSWEAEIVHPGFSPIWNISPCCTALKRLIHLLNLWKSIQPVFTPRVLQTALLVFEKCLTSQSLIAEHFEVDFCAVLPHAEPESLSVYL